MWEAILRRSKNEWTRNRLSRREDLSWPLRQRREIPVSRRLSAEGLGAIEAGPRVKGGHAGGARSLPAPQPVSTMQSL